MYKQNQGCMTLSSSTVAMLRNVIVVGCTRTRFKPIAMLTMKTELNGFLFLWMHPACSYSYGAPLGDPKLRY